MTWGTYTTDREVGGADAGVSGVLSVTGGNVSDFAGDSTTVEANAKFGVGATLEGVITSSGAPTASVEYGLGIPGLSAGVTTTTIEQSGSINVPEVRDQVIQQATEAAEQASEFVRTLPERIRESLNLPRSR
ncbi:MAG: hypothetical protein KF779_16375 [Hyphomonadaceae bacterium]|nr:hypothetical protein [Hyphomonadaceae bacterium]